MFLKCHIKKNNEPTLKDLDLSPDFAMFKSMTLVKDCSLSVSFKPYHLKC